MSMPNILTGHKILNAYETHILKNNCIHKCVHVYSHMCTYTYIFLYIHIVYGYTVPYVVFIGSELKQCLCTTNANDFQI